MRYHAVGIVACTIMCYEQEEVGEEKELGGDEDEGDGTEE